MCTKCDYKTPDECDKIEKGKGLSRSFSHTFLSIIYHHVPIIFKFIHPSSIYPLCLHLSSNICHQISHTCISVYLKNSIKRKHLLCVCMYVSVCVICIYCKCHRYYVHFSSRMNQHKQ